MTKQPRIQYRNKGSKKYQYISFFFVKWNFHDSYFNSIFRSQLSFHVKPIFYNAIDCEPALRNSQRRQSYSAPLNR